MLLNYRTIYYLASCPYEKNTSLCFNNAPGFRRRKTPRECFSRAGVHRTGETRTRHSIRQTGCFHTRPENSKTVICRIQDTKQLSLLPPVFCKKLYISVPVQLPALPDKAGQKDYLRNSIPGDPSATYLPGLLQNGHLTLKHTQPCACIHCYKFNH